MKSEYTSYGVPEQCMSSMVNSKCVIRLPRLKWLLQWRYSLSKDGNQNIVGSCHTSPVQFADPLALAGSSRRPGSRFIRSTSPERSPSVATIAVSRGSDGFWPTLHPRRRQWPPKIRIPETAGLSRVLDRFGFRANADGLPDAPYSASIPELVNCVRKDNRPIIRANNWRYHRYTKWSDQLELV